MNRDLRALTTAAFMGARDGYLAAKLGGTKVFGPDGLPEYASREPQAEKTGDDLFRDFAHLVQSRTH